MCVCVKRDKFRCLKIDQRGLLDGLLGAQRVLKRCSEVVLKGTEGPQRVLRGAIEGAQRVLRGCSEGAQKTKRVLKGCSWIETLDCNVFANMDDCSVFANTNIFFANAYN